MAKVGTLNTFTTKQNPIPSALFNSNNAALKAGINDIDETQINATSKIVLSDVATAITDVFTFSTNPVFNALAIADASLSANIPLKNGANTFAGVNTFDEAITGLKLPILGTHPTVVGDNNKVYEYSGDGNAYIYKHGTGAVRLDYTGTYTGGAVRSYAGSAVVDESSPLVIPFKCDVGFSAATISLIGLNFPSYIYTELAAHSHGIGTLALASGTVTSLDHTHTTDISHGHSGTFASSTHTHVGGNHNHSFSDSYSLADHNHGGNTGGTTLAKGESVPLGHNHTISNDGAATISISGNTSTENATTGAPSATASVSAYSGVGTISGTPTYSGTPAVGTALSGAIASAGIVGNTLNDTKKLNVTTAIKIYITQSIAAGWGTGYDSVTYSELLNILAGNGTGDINIFSKCAAGYNYIKIVDETVKTGGTIAWHLETS